MNKVLQKPVNKMTDIKETNIQQYRHTNMLKYNVETDRHTSIPRQTDEHTDEHTNRQTDILWRVGVEVVLSTF